uniref:NADH:ubiquinone oxidoreductase intermediate-associated protein 30 domain-containing protein n=1 Tax=Hemiselmis andersenii TaxID=464988 RepID=A0A6U2CT99_HEMAN|mmetsp:Transcript_21026/g.48631  ORF Transcript_21026/g.48631 Transcript_21026/m.48631 type:complete len:393 (+) Transcript_21026:81-1259(+)
MSPSSLLLLVATTSLFAVAINADKTLAGGSGGWSDGEWYVQVDGVMGGKSSGSLSFPSSSVMQFSGVISLDGGGFSSVRSYRMSHDLSSYAGVSVAFETMAPGSVPMGMHIQFAMSGSRYSYAAAYAIPPGQNAGDVATVFLPLWAFNRATSSGFLCSDCELDPTKVSGIDFYVLFQEGPFSVKILNVTAMDRVPEPPAGPTTPLANSAAVVSLISSTIKRSAYLYDQGYTELCTALYDATARLVAGSSSAADASRDAACAGLERATQVSSDPADRAWVLRRALDAVLAVEEGTALPGDGEYPKVAQGDWTANKQTSGWDVCRSGHPVTYPIVKPSAPSADSSPATAAATPAGLGAEPGSSVSHASRGAVHLTSVIMATAAGLLLRSCFSLV